MEDFFIRYELTILIKYISRFKETAFATPFPVLIENTFHNAQVLFA